MALPSNAMRLFCDLAPPLRSSNKMLKSVYWLADSMILHVASRIESVSLVRGLRPII